MLFHIPYLAYLGVASTAAVVVAGMMRFSLLRTEMRILLAFFIFFLFVNLSSLFFSIKLGNNLWFYHLGTLIEFCSFVFVFSFWQPTKKSRLVLRLLIIVFFVVWLLAKIFIEDFRHFDSFTSSFRGALLVMIALYIVNSLFQCEWQKPGRDFRFWVLSAALIYFTADVVFIALSNLIINLPQSDIVRLWSIHWLIGILANMLYLVAFLTDNLQENSHEPAVANS
jgi:hypothetical protein